MSKVLSIKFTDAAIRRYAAVPGIRELRDPGCPLRFRYRSNDRSRGSWHLVRYEKGIAKWRKAGNWPEISARTMLDNLPRVLARLQADPKAAAAVGAWSSVGELLGWYAVRVEQSRTLSDERRSTVLSAIRCWLSPNLGHLALADLNKAAVDRCLYMPMQAACKPAHVRAVFGVLKQAFKRAQALGFIESNPVALVAFGDFDKTKISPKGARLRYTAVPDLLEQWADSFDDRSRPVTLAVLMLGHGTRITETRISRWHEIDLINGEWFVPARNTKARRDHVLPLTPQMIEFLRRYRLLQARDGYAGAFVFPAAGRSGKPMSRSEAFACFAELGQGEWTSHDLRKLARTLWAEQGVDSTVGRLLLNQALPVLELTYIQTNAMALKRAALENWHDWLDQRGFSALHTKTEPRPVQAPITPQPGAITAYTAVTQPNV